ncbi:unnamed protein product [Oppiella nova]|uniref:Nuclear pore complex protein Nup88 n=1 Tax=Oppiella nova TaxID=334625 RepID=A0A7R9L7A6_9ACAR|nr:unnamed protein product [Oppiella nova]CAG2157020.1 unnamed protein product [Oppiella nova]
MSDFVLICDSVSSLTTSAAQPDHRCADREVVWTGGQGGPGGQWESRSLMYYSDNQVFIWQTTDQCVYCLTLRDETSITSVQSSPDCESAKKPLGICLILTNAPLFDVENVDLCGTGRFLSVWGGRGISIVELPPKWGAFGGYEGGKSSVLSRSWSLGQRFFICNQNIQLLCSRWHPNSPQQHIVLLINDNSLRIFDIHEEETPIQVIDLSATDPNSSVKHFGVSAFATSLGDNAVSYDFGPSISKCYDVEPSAVTTADECLTPIYVLRGNGDVLLVYSSLKYAYVSNNVFGPLTMRPPAEDNYGVDACSIVCLDCVPPVLVIATSFGVLHHCIALDGDNELDSNQALLPQPTLYVYETIELSLSLTTSSDMQDMSSTLRLHKDHMIPMRYFCSHSCGLHAISVPFVSQLKSKDEQNFHEEESIVEHLICTKPIAGANESTDDNAVPIVPLGVAVGVQNGYTFVLVMLSSGELMGRRLTPTYIAHLFDGEDNGLDDNESNVLSDISVPKVDFNEYIKQLLKRNTSVPLLKSKEPTNKELSQNLELLLTTTDTLKSEYIKRYDLVANAIDKRAKVLTNDKEVQLQELNKCLSEKDSLMNGLLVLVDKYDETRERQEGLTERINKVLECLQFQRPELSAAEMQLRDELNLIRERVGAHRNKLQQIQVKCKYQTQHNQQIGDQSTDLSSAQRGSPHKPIPSPNQMKGIREMLANQSESVAELLQTVNKMTKSEAIE